MDILVSPSRVQGVISAPPSKSYAHRYIIASFLSKIEGFINNCQPSKDVMATLGVLEKLGLKFNFENGGVAIKFGEKTNNPMLDCNESGSTLRFLLPIVSALGVTSEFTGSKRLLERPISDLVECLNKNGSDIVGLKLNGKLNCGNFKINGNISSQFITGLLFALPLLNGDSTIEIVGERVSQNYIDITLDVLEKFGIKITDTQNGYFIKGNQKFISPSFMSVEGDYSNASFLLSLGALGDGVTVTNLNKNSKQGDSKIVEILRDFGAEIKEVENGYFAKTGDLKGVIVDAEDIPDIVQILSVVASYAKGKSVFKKVKRLEIKESNRVLGIVENLKNCGIKAEYNGNDLTVYGGEVKGATFSGDNDHRTVMSAIVTATFAKGNSKILGYEAIQKSYPTFIENYVSLGGKVNGNI